MPMPVLDFWFDFASTYSYLSALRIEQLAAGSGIAVRWRPFLLGPIFASQGWSTSPFNLYEVKGRYMVRDIGRIAAQRGIGFRLPAPFPQHSVLAARVALGIEDMAQRGAFSRAVMVAQFADGLAINEPGTMQVCLERAGLVPGAHLQRAQSDAVKAGLRTQTEAARALGIFGAPTTVTPDGEMFWGDDRLEAAIAWACSPGGRASV